MPHLHLQTSQNLAWLQMLDSTVSKQTFTNASPDTVPVILEEIVWLILTKKQHSTVCDSITLKIETTKQNSYGGSVCVWISSRANVPQSKKMCTIYSIIFNPANAFYMTNTGMPLPAFPGKFSSSKLRKGMKLLPTKLCLKNVILRKWVKQLC